MGIKVPATLEEAVDRLDGVGKLLTASEWERAAILAAYVKPDKGNGGRREVSESRHLLSAREFARKGVHGLRDPSTVLRYVGAWLAKVGAPPEPGATVELPTDPFPQTDAVARTVRDPERREAIREQAKADGTGAAKALDVASNLKAMAAAIKADPDTAAAAHRALIDAREQERKRQARDERKKLEQVARDHVAAAPPIMAVPTRKREPVEPPPLDQYVWSHWSRGMGDLARFSAALDGRVEEAVGLLTTQQLQANVLTEGRLVRLVNEVHEAMQHELRRRTIQEVK